MHTTTVRLARALLAIIAVTSAGACSTEEDSTPDPDAALPDPSPKGEPAGEPRVATIGPEGGTIDSADGLLTLVVPAGAVAEATEFGVQPITNTAPPSFGNAYRLTPEGATFDVEPTLEFHYADLDLHGTGEDVLGIAFQDADGRWEIQEDAVVDKDAKVVSVPTAHFSDWSLFFGAQLMAKEREVEVNGLTELMIKNCVYSMPGLLHDYVWSCKDQGEEDISGLLPFFQPDHATWAVQGKLGGSSTTGTARKWGPFVGMYFAPKTKPSSPLTAAVSVRDKGGRLLSENIAVKQHDGFRVDVAMKETASSLPCIYGTSTLSDKASFAMIPNEAGTLIPADLTNEPSVAEPVSAPGGTITIDAPPVWNITKVTVIQAMLDNAGNVRVQLNLAIKRQMGICTYVLSEGGTIHSTPMPEYTQMIAAQLAFKTADLPVTLTEKTAPNYTFTIDDL